jgi:hypothetical protein
MLKLLGAYESCSHLLATVGAFLYSRFIFSFLKEEISRYRVQPKTASNSFEVLEQHDIPDLQVANGSPRKTRVQIKRVPSRRAASGPTASLPRLLQRGKSRHHETKTPTPTDQTLYTATSQSNGPYHPTGNTTTPSPLPCRTHRSVPTMSDTYPPKTRVDTRHRVHN